MLRWDLILGGAIGFIFGYLAGTAAKAADAAYCELWSREQTQIEVVTTESVDMATMTQEAVLRMRAKAYLWCLGADPQPMLEGADTEQAWVSRTYELMVARAQSHVASLGTEPAKENPNEEAWRAQCRAEYSTWDEATGTVIRRGNPERVRCPCGTVVQCVQ